MLPPPRGTGHIPLPWAKGGERGTDLPNQLFSRAKNQNRKTPSLRAPGGGGAGRLGFPCPWRRGIPRELARQRQSFPWKPKGGRKGGDDP